MCNRNYTAAVLAELQSIAANPRPSWRWLAARWWKRTLWQWRYRFGF